MKNKNYILLAKKSAKLIYALIKLLPTQNKVVLISRVNKTISVDFILLRDRIKEVSPTTKVVVLNHKLQNKMHLFIDVIKEMYHLATSKSAIIDSYIIPVSILTHKKDLIIVQIWHSIGVSKNFGYTALGLKEGASREIAEIMEMHKNYDYLIASGQSSIDYYKKSFKISEEKILNIGIPRIDYLIKEKYRESARESIYNKYPILLKKQNILYAPTFRKGLKIPYADIINEVDFEKYNLIIKQHHLDKTEINDNRIINLSDENIFDLLFVSNYLITDYSALMFEAAIIEIPMFFYTYDIENYEKRRGLTISLTKDLPGTHSDDAKKIIKAIEKNKFNIETIRNFRDKHIDNIDGNATKRIVDLLKLGENKNEK